MTNIITRYFPSASRARDVAYEMIEREGFPARIVKYYDQADGLADKLGKQLVDPDAAKTYAARMDKSGGAVLLVRAKARPLAAAKKARALFEKMGVETISGITEDVYFRDGREGPLARYREVPHIFTRPSGRPYKTTFMANWPIPLISRRKPATPSVIRPHGRMASWPIGLLLPGNVRYGRFPFDFLVPGHKFMAKFPFDHLIPGHKFMANFPFGHIVPGHKFMANFPFGHIVPGHKFMAKFPFGHLVPGQPRMANWPFPLLIDGEKHTNSLVPGHKYMAKFPFAHIVPGHKFQAKFPFGHIVPGHKFMAKFPFAHIVPGHKFMARFPFDHLIPGHKFQANFPFGHIVPGHKYMANWIFPHTKTKAS